MAAALAASLAVLAIGGVSSFAPIGAVLAQTPGTSGPVTFNLFTGDSVALDPKQAPRFADAVRKAQAAGDSLAPGQCPKPKITVTVPKGDDLFQQALVAAQIDALKAFLGRDADKFLFVPNIAGTTNNVAIDASVADTAPPTITVTPPSGTKVKNGQRLTIRVTATEPSTGWQAGVKQIQIEDLDRHTNLAPWDNPAPAPRPCGDAGLTQTIERSYVVPPDVPVAHLKITARDYHNPQHAVLVEYPTGDWHGQIKWSQFTPSSQGHHGTIDLSVSYDGRGNLTGRAVGEEHIASPSPSCTITVSTPGRTSVKVVGQYTPGANTMSLQFVESDETVRTVGVYQMKCRPTGEGSGKFYPVAFGVGLDGVLNNLTVSATGSVDAERALPRGGTTLRVSLKLRRAQD